MLHNPQWDRGTLPGLVHWLESHDPATTYNFASCTDCLIARYMDGVARSLWRSEIHDIFVGRDPHLIARGTEMFPSYGAQTYGQALERAHKAVAATV